MKKYIKALPVNRDCFNIICRVFSALTIKKLKAVTFDGPHIPKLIKIPCFVLSICCSTRICFNDTKLPWKVKNWKLAKVGKIYFPSSKDLCVKMSIKVNYTFFPLDRFQANLVDLIGVSNLNVFPQHIPGSFTKENLWISANWIYYMIE